MSKTKNKFWQILRWIFFMPLSALIYHLSKDIISLTFSFINRNFVEEMNTAIDFGEYTFWGPIFIFVLESLSIGFGVYSGVYLAPKHKKKVFFVFVFFFVFFLSLLSYYSFNLGLDSNTAEINGFLFRIIIITIATIFGLTVSGIYIWREQKKIKEKNNIDFEGLDKHF